MLREIAVCNSSFECLQTSNNSLKLLVIERCGVLFSVVCLVVCSFVHRTFRNVHCTHLFLLAKHKSSFHYICRSSSSQRRSISASSSPLFLYLSIRARVWVVVSQHCRVFGIKVCSKTFSFIQKICVSISNFF